MGGLGAGKSNLRPQTASDVFTVALTLLAIAVAAGSVAFASSLPLPSLLTLSNEPRRRSSFAQRCLAVVVLATAVGVGELLLRRRARTLHTTVAGTAGRQVHHVALSSVRFSAPAAGYTLLAVLVVAALAIGLPAWRRRRWATALGPLVPMQAHPGPDALAGDARDGSLPAAIMAVSVANPEDEPDSRRAIVAAYLAMTQAAWRAAAPLVNRTRPLLNTYVVCSASPALQSAPRKRSLRYSSVPGTAGRRSEKRVDRSRHHMPTRDPRGYRAPS